MIDYKTQKDRIRSILDRELNVGWLYDYNEDDPYWDEYIIDGKDRATEEILKEWNKWLDDYLADYYGGKKEDR